MLKNRLKFDVFLTRSKQQYEIKVKSMKNISYFCEFVFPPER